MSATAAVDHADHHGPIEWPDDPQYGRATAGKIGMWIFLLSDCLSFAGLLLAYGIPLAKGLTIMLIVRFASGA